MDWRSESGIESVGGVVGDTWGRRAVRRREESAGVGEVVESVLVHAAVEAAGGHGAVVVGAPDGAAVGWLLVRAASGRAAAVEGERKAALVLLAEQGGAAVALEYVGGAEVVVAVEKGVAGTVVAGAAVVVGVGSAVVGSWRGVVAGNWRVARGVAVCGGVCRR